MSVLLHCRLFEIAFDICYTVYVQYHYCLYSYIFICWITIYLFSQLEFELLLNMAYVISITQERETGMGVNKTLDFKNISRLV